ncbi:MAG: PilZ domain-containing protein [Terriglobales bacterium]
MSSENSGAAMQGPKTFAERVTLKLPLQISGSDLSGRDFMDSGYTKILNRNGAAIVVNRLLGPDQVLVIRWVGDTKEAEVRVIGQIGSEPDGKVYGVAFLDPTVDLWHIDFSPASGGVMLRVLLECPGCRNREIVPLTEFELEVFETNGNLTRRCNKCRDTTLWSQSKDDRPPESDPAPVAPQATAAAVEARKERRKASRMKIKRQGCILFCQQETPVDVLDMSRGGIRFQTPKSFADDLLVRVAVPYTPGTANIFVPARIRWSRTLPSGAFEYGMEYVKS